MNSNSILQSNLLDIIFENRNKDYGAYVLRRDYNKRLLQSLFAMLGLVIILSVLQMFKKNNTPLNLSSIFNKPDTLTVSAFKKPEEPKLPIKPAQAQMRAASMPNNKPLIVVDNLVKEIPATAQQILFSNIGETKDGPPTEGQANETLNTKSTEISPPEKLAAPETKAPVDVAEVMPQYPGGINEFIKFMKKNLKSPRDLEENEEVAIKVHFIVSVDGSLQGFTIIESGSKIFDDEVIKVLKKMPKWIPGKSKGENVSVYFTLPVKFTAEQ